MKKLLLITGIIMFLNQLYNIAYAQNLVPNPSFEDTVHCPNSGGQVWNAKYWYTAENTPDYYNVCCSGTNPNFSVPSNIYGVRNAATGDAYCGFCAYDANNPDVLYREYIGVPLISPLTIGTKYYVSYKLSKANSIGTGGNFTNCATNKIGLLFSTIKYDI